MALDIETSIRDQLAPMVKEALSKLPADKQSMFVDEYQRKAKSPVLMLLLAIFFPIQLFLLGKTGAAIAFWLTFGGLGIWWFVEVCLAMKRTNDFNRDVATAIVRDIKVLA
jgi:hypothetical protein